MAERIQLSRRKGWRMPPNTVSVARHADVLLELANIDNLEGAN